MSMICKNIKQKYEVFQRNGFVLPARKSTMVNNNYLEAVSTLSFLQLLSCVTDSEQRNLGSQNISLETMAHMYSSGVQQMCQTSQQV